MQLSENWLDTYEDKLETFYFLDLSFINSKKPSWIELRNRASSENRLV
jgi:hypothetical protein